MNASAVFFFVFQSNNFLRIFTFVAFLLCLTLNALLLAFLMYVVFFFDKRTCASTVNNYGNKSYVSQCFIWKIACFTFLFFIWKVFYEIKAQILANYIAQRNVTKLLFFQKINTHNGKIQKKKLTKSAKVFEKEELS